MQQNSPMRTYSTDVACSTTIKALYPIQNNIHIILFSEFQCSTWDRNIFCGHGLSHWQKPFLLASLDRSPSHLFITTAEFQNYYRIPIHLLPSHPYHSIIQPYVLGKKKKPTAFWWPTSFLLEGLCDIATLEAPLTCYVCGMAAIHESTAMVLNHADSSFRSVLITTVCQNPCSISSQ